MTRFESQIMYGLTICVTGVMIAMLSFDPSRKIQYVLASGILLSAVFAFITSQKYKKTEVRTKYHGLISAGMLAYAIAIFFYAADFENFILLTMAFLVYFGITEMIFGFQLLQYKRKINVTVIGLKVLTGFLLTIGAVVSLGFGAFDKNMSLLIAGILIALSGINFVLFADDSMRMDRLVLT